MHMHVAVDDPEKAIQVMNGLLAAPAAAARAVGELAVLARRADRARRRPADGLLGVPALGRRRRASASYADYAEVVGQLERTGCIADYTHIWWDIRPHPRLGTIELRICDAVTRLEDVVAIAAFFQALVKLLLRACTRRAARSRAATGS